MEKPSLKTISVDKLDGGRVNFPDQTMIDQSACSSGSMNVWCPNGVLTKTPGLSLVASFTASGTSNLTDFFVDDALSTAGTMFYVIGVTATGGGIGTSYYLHGSSYNFTDSLTPLGYAVGTIAISGVSATGSGTLWSIASGSAGLGRSNLDRLQTSQNKNGWYIIKSVEDDTHLTLLSAVPTAVSAGTSYIAQHGVINNSCHGVVNGKAVLCANLDYQIMFDGTNTYRMTASSTASATPPGANFFDTYSGYLVAGFVQTNIWNGGTIFPSRIAWSALGDPTTWPTNNFIDVDLNHFGNISGLKSFGQELIIFKQRGMYKLVGSVLDPSNPTFYIQKITTPPDFFFNANGSCAIHSVGQPMLTFGATTSYTNNVLLFYAGGRVYMYRQGTSFITCISDNILLDMPNQTVVPSNYNAINAYQDQQISGFSYNGYYILVGLSTPNYTDPSNGFALLLDRNMKWWLMHNDNNTGAQGSWSADPFGGIYTASSFLSLTGRPFFATIPSSTLKSRLLVASNLNCDFGRLYAMDMIGPTYTTTYPLADSANTAISYSTVPINGKWVSKEFNIEYGTFYAIVIYLQKQAAGNLTVQWSIDQQTQVSYTIDMTQGRGKVIRAVIPIQQKGSTIQLTLSNNVASQTFGIYAVKLLYFPSDAERLL